MDYIFWAYVDYDVSVVFFFSSRRRHTRLQGDWSSDVCSSDLCALPPPRTAAAGVRRRKRLRVGLLTWAPTSPPTRPNKGCSATRFLRSWRMQVDRKSVV